jgi:amino acid adenylation domain-containing protein
MAEALLAAESALPGIADALADLDRRFTQHAGWSIRAVLDGTDPRDLDDPATSHAAIFTLQVALAHSLRERGHTPDAVIGHSGGEVAAAVTAGALALDDAIELVLAHGALMNATPSGAMLHVDLAPTALQPWLERARAAGGGAVELAVRNAENAVVLAGDDISITALSSLLEQGGIGHRRLRIRLPFHSAAVVPGLDDFRACLSGLTPLTPHMPYYSAWRGGLAHAGDFDADYWARHVREPVRFFEAAQAMLADGYACCVEIAPHPALLQHIAAAGRDAGFLGYATLHREAGVAPLLDWLRETSAPIDAPAPSAGRTDHLPLLRTLLTQLLPEPAGVLPADWAERTWSELGLSSAQLVAYGKRLAERIERPLPATLAYRCPTPALLADYLSTSGAAANPAAAPAPTADTPIAVIGMACRFPGGANTPQAYWELLTSGRDAVGEIPPDRWSIAEFYDPSGSVPGKSSSRWGGFIIGQDIRTVDDRLFRITPREASALDPQQRLLLEVAWEALENAGIAPLSLKGKRVAVYTGLSTDDYKTATLYGADLATLDPYSGAGTMACTASGRLSYYFGWQGANITVDTACSSSLVALHLAHQALRSGECDLALVAGVNVLLTPHLYVYFSRVGALSPTGRCHTFDAAADGYVRAEGCGVLVLERQADALRQHHRPRARIAATAVNQDGASTGFSAPNGAAQTNVIGTAWRAAGAAPGDIAYVEAHGTGTPVGDPIELESLAAALGERDPADPLRVGSVKSQIGHLEAAAGVAGVMKVILALEHDQLPANLHFHTPNPRLDWARLPLAVVDHAQPWPRRGARRLAGVSSFGFSGTNAHVVIEGVSAPPTTAPAAPGADAACVLLLSAPDDQPLRELARNSAAALAQLEGAAAADFIWSNNTGRQPFARRVAAAAATPAELARALAAWADDRPTGATARVATGHGAATSLVFAFTGQGCQYAGMARPLYEREPVFRDVIDRCDAEFTRLRGRSLLGYLLDADTNDTNDTSFDRIDLAQPAVFMQQCALAALWVSRGITPAAVIGHSAGEVAAGVAAGVLTLERGIALVEARSRLMATHPPSGEMVSVASDENSVTAAIAAAAPGVVYIAGINSPDSVVISGDSAGIARVVTQLGIPPQQARHLRISNAFHTPLLAPLAEALAAHCEQHLASARRGHTAWISSMDARDLSASGTDPDYWAAQLQQPVRFDAALAALEKSNHGIYLEIGPAAVLTVLGSERASGAMWIPSQQRGVDGVLALSGALAALAAAGHTVAWDAWQGGGENQRAPRRVDLPPYPFQRRHHWLAPAYGATAAPIQPCGIEPMPTAPDATAALATVRTLIAEITGLAADEITPDTALLDLGMDSLMLLQLKGHLEARHGLVLKIAELYDGVETAALIAARLPASAPAAAPAAPSVTAPAASATAAPLQPAMPSAPRAALAGAGVEGLMALQLETMSRLMSEQLAALGHAAVPAAAPVATPAPVAATPQTASDNAPSTPNFRSLTLESDRFTPEQQAFVADLTRRYVARTPGSRALSERYRGPLSDWKNTLSYRHSFKEMTYPIAARSSHGAWFTDVDGNEFLDITMGCGIAVLGHSPQCVVERVVEQAQTHFAIGPQTPLAGEVAEIFCRMTGMERVTFCNTGAEAVMMALRTARAVTGRRKVAIFAGAYHGTWDGVLGVEHDGHVWPIADGIPPGMVEDLVILNYGTDEALATLEACAHELAAVLVEPVQSRRPGLQPAEFLRALRRITEAAGSALIFDEMITGFRIAPGGAQAHFGVRADLATYGKIAGGGLPLSAVAGSARFLDRVDGGPWQYGDDSAPRGDLIYFGGTYVKHPLALAAASAALSHLEALGEDAYTALNARSQGMAETLNAWFAAEQVPMQVQHFGSLFRFDGSGRYSAMMQPVELDLFFFLLLLRGIYVWERRVLFLSFAHDDDAIARVIEAVKEAVVELRAGGFEFRAGGTQPGKAGGRRDSAVAPASSAQRRLYALEQIEGRSTVYNVPLALTLSGPLDLARLQSCFTRLAERHEALRTRFTLDGDALVQQVLPPEQAPLTLEVRDCPAADFLAEAEATIRPFELNRAPLMRVTLLRSGPDSHALLMDAHHIVVDGLSLNIIARELMALYEGRTLPALPARPIDMVSAQTAYLDSPECAADAAWWRARFADLPPAIALPLDFPRPPRRGHRGGDALALLDASATSALKAAARGRRLTLFGLALGVFGAFLHRLTGQQDLVIGLPVGGRGDPRFTDLIGMFANTLPLRVASDGNAPLGDFARACQSEFLGALEHQDYPLEALIADLRLPRDLARNPLFDTMFIFEDGNDRVYRMAGLECAPLPASRHAAMFDLAMEVIEAEGVLQLRLEYDTELFTPASAARLVELYRQLLELAPASLDCTLSELDCIPPTERAQLAAWSDGSASPAPHTTIPALFAQQLQARPDAPALLADGQCLSYRELDARANRIAHALLALLPQPGVTRYVAVVAERGVDLVAGLLGILKAGAAYVPVDPDFPSERVTLMLEDSGCAAVLVSASLRERLALPAGVAVLAFDEVTNDLPATDPGRAVAPDDAAYLIYTSGSTGTPKGARLRQRNAASFFAALPQAFGFAPGQRILALTTVSFDIAGLELLGALCCGMTVVMASAPEGRDPARLLARMSETGVEVVQITPTRLRLLLEAGGLAALAPLRTLLVGGEALPPDLARELATLSDTAVFNVYGPTETTIWSAYHRLDLHHGDDVALGRPLPGERIHILSAQQRLQPLGAIGEIAIAGDGVGDGYHNRAELSAERFRLLPEIDAAPLYLSGDLGRWRADGRLEYFGRTDDQIKVRGMRIEPSEIEHRLRAIAGVRDALVVARAQADGDTELIAYLATDLTPDPAAWRTALAEHLPDPLLPARFVTLAALPQTPNGKIDRRALPDPEPLQPASLNPAREPANPREAAIVAAFASVLGTQIGPEDDYFAHGGDSIRALRVVARLREAGYELELEALFRRSTAATLAPLLDLRTEPRHADAADNAPTYSGLDEDEVDDLFV